MNLQNTRRGSTQTIVNKKKTCPEGFLLRTFHACRGKNKGEILFNNGGCVEDPQLQPLGMTIFFNNNQEAEDPRQKHSGMTPNFNTPAPDLTVTLSPAGEGPFPMRGKVGNARMRGYYKEEALNKDPFRAPLRSGFTLIELLVVVLIIGILAAVALPQYQKAVIKSRVAEYKANLKTIAEAAEVCKLSKGGVCSLDELNIDVELPTPIPQFHGNSTLAYGVGENYVEIYTPNSYAQIKYYYTPTVIRNYDPVKSQVITKNLDAGFYCASAGKCSKIGFNKYVDDFGSMTLYKE